MDRIFLENKDEMWIVTKTISLIYLEVIKEDKIQYWTFDYTGNEVDYREIEG